MGIRQSYSVLIIGFNTATAQIHNCDHNILADHHTANMPTNIDIIIHMCFTIDMNKAACIKIKYTKLQVPHPASIVLPVSRLSTLQAIM